MMSPVSFGPMVPPTPARRETEYYHMATPKPKFPSPPSMNTADVRMEEDIRVAAQRAERTAVESESDENWVNPNVPLRKPSSQNDTIYYDSERKTRRGGEGVSSEQARSTSNERMYHKAKRTVMEEDNCGGNKSNVTSSEPTGLLETVMTQFVKVMER